MAEVQVPVWLAGVHSRGLTGPLTGHAYIPYQPINLVDESRAACRRKPRLTVLAILVLLLLSFACEVRVSKGTRSGSLSEDYAEEPLSADARQYERALEMSNTIMDLLLERDYRRIVDSLVDRRSAPDITQQRMLDIFRDVESHAGPGLRYKRLQWGFVARQEGARSLLYSTKIVEHEKFKMRYVFIFIDDGTYRRIAGFYVRGYTGVAAPGEL